MSKKIVLKNLFIGFISFFISFVIFAETKALKKDTNIAENIENLSVCYNYPEVNKNNSVSYIKHKKIKRKMGGKPVIINIITVNPFLKKLEIKPSYGTYFLNSVKSVKDFASSEQALVGINASFFKPDTGAPLGISIIDGEILTGPIYKRVVFGVTKENKFLMDKLDITGQIKIGKKIKLKLINYNQPVFNKNGYTIFTDRWGKKTPSTSFNYRHVVVKDNKVQAIKQSCVNIPKGGYVLVGSGLLIKDSIKKGDKVSYSIKLSLAEWQDVKYAVGGGPYLVKKGKIFVDKQKFTDNFLWKKEPRTAIGFTKAGTLILVTVDGRRKGISEGATMSELAKIMWEMGAYNAMNLDGGSSTQMVYKDKLVNNPTVKGGGKVTNALLIVPIK